MKPEREREVPKPTAGQRYEGLRDKHAILDRAALLTGLLDLGGEDTSGAQRPAALALLKQALAQGRAEVERRFAEGATGRTVSRANCYLADQLIGVLYDYVASALYPSHNPSEGERLALIAVGGYGRGELAPYSDLDLLFLQPYKTTPRSEQVVEAILYFLWDLGFKVGQATRSVQDCLRQAKADMTIRTGLLEARFLWGDQALALELRDRLWKEVQSGSGPAFIEAKLAERDERHKRMGGSRYSLEPNIKDGKGGLRDLHTLFWIAKYLYHVDRIADLVGQVFTGKEVARFRKAESFLWTLRCHLHYRAGRAEERLTFDLQKRVAPLMGYRDHAGSQDVERLMKHYFLVAKDVGSLTRIFCAALETQHRRRSRFRLPTLMRRRKLEGFQVEYDRLTVAGPEVFAERPVEMLRIFKVGQARELDIHPDALRWITQNLKRIGRSLRAAPEANEIFLDILTSPKAPDQALRRMNEAGVLGRFIPEFGRVVAQMQYNMYHHYTVDEHTIFAIGVLRAVEEGALAEEVPIATEVVHKVLSRQILYLAVLLHDIAKGRKGDHSVLGAQVANGLCPRLGLSEEQTETVAWLVEHHLVMSDTAQRRDLDDPKTIEDFAELVQSTERLRLLLVLTVADIRATAANLWSNWKAVLLRELYWRTEEVLTGGLSVEGREARVEQTKAALAVALADWPRADIDRHLSWGYPSYWLSYDTDTLVRHAKLVRDAETSDRRLSIVTRVDDYRESTEVTIYAADHAGLFSRIAGAMAVAGASIDAAKIRTLVNGMALDSFYIRDSQGGAFARPHQLARLRKAIEDTLEGRMNPSVELTRQRSPFPSRLSVFRIQPRVLVDNKASASDTVIEINAKDRPALLHQVTRALTRLNLVIHSAKISTYGERVVDAFYVQDPLGSKIESEAKIARIRTKLLEVLSAPAEPVPGSKPGAASKAAVSAAPP